MCGLVEGIKDIGRSIDDNIFQPIRERAPEIATAAGYAFGGPLGGTLGSVLGTAIEGGNTSDYLRHASQAFSLGSGVSSFLGGGPGNLGSMFGMGGGAGSAAANLYAGSGFYGFGAGGGEASGGNFLSSMFGGGGASSALGGVGDLLRGGFGLYQANQLRQAGQPSAINQQADAQLQALLANPSGVTNLPGYEAGLEAVQRGMAAGGYLGSGNMAAALQKYGGDFYNNAIGQYSGLSQLGRGNDANYRMGSIQLAGQALNSLGYGGLKLFGK